LDVWTFVIGMTVLQAGAFFLFVRYQRAEARRKPAPETRAEKREERLTELYEHIEELMDVFETYVEEVRQDFERERAALTELSRQAATLYMRGLETAAPTLSSVALPMAAVASGAAAAPGVAAMPMPPRAPHIAYAQAAQAVQAVQTAPTAPTPIAVFPPMVVAPSPGTGSGAPVIRPAAFPAFDTPTPPTADKTPEPPSRLSSRDKEALGRFATKPQKVRFLMSRGLALDEVARELSIGRGEVRLIAELEK
jgi:hypothetical protein